MLHFIRKHYIFLSICLTYILVGGIIVALQPEHGDLVLWINKNHQWITDQFFNLCTLFGDGRFIALFVVIYIFKNWRRAIFIGLALGVNSGIIQFLKHKINAPRPYKYWWHIHDTFHYVLPVEEVHTDFSFPSGHTNGAITLLFCLVIISTKNTTLQIILGILAVCTAISRMVLMQHFLIDTVVGAAVSICITTLVYFISKQIPYIKEGLEE